MRDDAIDDVTRLNMSNLFTLLLVICMMKVEAKRFLHVRRISTKKMVTRRILKSFVKQIKGQV